MKYEEYIFKKNALTTKKGQLETELSVRESMQRKQVEIGGFPEINIVEIMNGATFTQLGELLIRKEAEYKSVYGNREFRFELQTIPGAPKTLSTANTYVKILEYEDEAEFDKRKNAAVTETRNQLNQVNNDLVSLELSKPAVISDLKKKIIELGGETS